MPRVLIVGGGILGTAHANEAIGRGFAVEQFEAAAEPHASTARSPGALHFSRAAAGLELALSERAASGWAQLAGADPDSLLRATGSFAVARDELEAETLMMLAQRPDADARGWRLLDRAATVAANPALGGEFVASLYSDLDVVVEPRALLDGLRSRLAGLDDYRFRGGREIRDFGADSVTDVNGRVHRGDLVVLCPGNRSDLTTSALRQPAVLRALRIQIAQTEPFGTTLTAPVSDLTALLRHGLDPMATMPASHSDPRLGTVELRLTCVQRPGGALTIGEARQSEEPFDFDVPERPTKTLVAELETMLGRSVPPVTRQWTGTVRECTDGRLWFRDTLDETVALVTGADSRGITLAPAIAEETFDWLLDGVDSGATHPGATTR